MTAATDMAKKSFTMESPYKSDLSFCRSYQPDEPAVVANSIAYVKFLSQSVAALHKAALDFSKFEIPLIAEQVPSASVFPRVSRRR
jgi:hypothetical protein